MKHVITCSVKHLKKARLINSSIPGCNAKRTKSTTVSNVTFNYKYCIQKKKHLFGLRMQLRTQRECGRREYHERLTLSQLSAKESG
jgi:hypothetical protein